MIPREASPDLLVHRDGDVMHLTLNRPDKGNALSAALVRALTREVENASEAGVRLLVLSGEGRHFCTGFDLSDLDNETDDSLLARFTRIELLLQAIHAAPFDTVALAHGRTMGAGADLFCACAQRWLVGEASFAFPGAAFGLVLGTSRLADTVGSIKAREWIEAGTMIDGDQALRTGLATRRMAPQDLAGALSALGERAHRLETWTQQAIHRALQISRQPRGEAGLAQDLQRLVQSAARPGIQARISAYRAAQQRR